MRSKTRIGKPVVLAEGDGPVRSMTRRSLATMSMKEIRRNRVALGSRRWVGAVRRVDTPVGPLYKRSASISAARRAAGGVGREVRVCHPGREQDNPVLLQVSDRRRRI